MGAREFEMVKGAMLRIDPLAGDSLRVRTGEVWVTQYGDARDYMLKAGDSLALNGEGAALATACKPTLLDLFRADPAGVRESIELEARRLRTRSLRIWLRKILRAPRKLRAQVAAAFRDAGTAVSEREAGNRTRDFYRSSGTDWARNLV